MSDDRRSIIEKARRREPGLAGRKVLIVDDDIRNIFSLTGVLEQHDIEVLNAESGREGIAMLNDTPSVDMVLMDVMMPDMDGYETMRQIRRSERFRKLPMIAITAKAMKGDREKCIEAGASEYISKPVDVDQLVSMMRVWLRRV
jgi:CheY-like chemotaxis protein